jgi:hypothetical protein
VTSPFRSPQQVAQDAAAQLLLNPQTGILRTQAQAEMERAQGRAFTVDTAGFQQAVVALISEELRAAGWVVTPDSSSKSEPFLNVRPARVAPREDVRD